MPNTSVYYFIFFLIFGRTETNYTYDSIWFSPVYAASKIRIFPFHLIAGLIKPNKQVGVKLNDVNKINLLYAAETQVCARKNNAVTKTNEIKGFKTIDNK